MRTYISALTIMSLVFFSSCGDDEAEPQPQPQPTTGTIIGQITDLATGSPIDAATVKTLPATSEVSTNNEGNFSIANVSPGSYDVIVVKESYKSDTTQVVVTAGMTATSDIALSAESDSYVQVDDMQFPLNLGYNVWFSELDCGNFDVFAHGLYLSSDITIEVFDVGETGKTLRPSGIGNRLIFNMYNKNSALVPGVYNFVDEVDCNGIVTDDGSSFSMGPDDLFVTAVKEVDEPTSYALNVDLDIDWSTELDDPSDETIDKATKYREAQIGIKEGTVTIEMDGDIYHITFDCIDDNGKQLTGEFTGALEFIEFGV